MPDRKVLIITNQGDVHASEVIGKLNGRDVGVLRLNTENLLRNCLLAFRQNKDSDELLIRALDSGKEICLGEIGAVYYRRPMEPLPYQDVGVDDPAHSFASEESYAFLHSMYPALGDVYWLSDPFSLRRAASKPLQTRIARECGLKIPDTLFTNQPAAVETFCRQHDMVAFKSMHQNGYVENGVSRAFYTCIVPSTKLLESLENARLVINFIQEAIPKDHELRVTYVGGKMFCVRIDSQKATELAVDDWRQEHYSKVPHSAIETPAAIRDGIIHFMEAMKMDFGCLDFIATPDGDYYFLECNFNGQWLWLENLTDVPIAKAIADLLIARMK